MTRQEGCILKRMCVAGISLVVLRLTSPRHPCPSAMRHADPVSQYPETKEAGGLSGPPLMSLSTAVLADMYRLTKGAIPLVGVGGVAFGQDRLVEFATLGGDIFTELLERFRLRICRGSSML